MTLLLRWPLWRTMTPISKVRNFECSWPQFFFSKKRRRQQRVSELNEVSNTVLICRHWLPGYPVGENLRGNRLFLLMRYWSTITRNRWTRQSVPTGQVFFLVELWVVDGAFQFYYCLTLLFWSYSWNQPRPSYVLNYISFYMCLLFSNLPTFLFFIFLCSSADRISFKFLEVYILFNNDYKISGKASASKMRTFKDLSTNSSFKAAASRSVQ